MSYPADGIWTHPIVIEKNALVSPFFTSIPLPYIITDRHLKYFFRALVELSQVVYYVSVNTPICGQKENRVLRQFLIFHVEHFLNVSFRVPDFVRHLHPKHPTDKTANDFLRFLDVEGESFLADWNCGIVFGNQLSPMELRAVLIRVKARADSIAGYIVAHNISAEQFTYKPPMWERMNDFFSQYSFPSWCSYFWILTSAFLALFISVLCWLVWKRNFVLGSVFATIFSFIQFIIFLLMYYLFHRRAILAEWYARELTVNHSKSYFALQKDVLSGNSEQSEVQFSVVRKKGVPQVLNVKEREVQGLITMIAFTKKMKIIIWNPAAQTLTQFTEEDVIGQSLRLLLDSTSIGAIQEFIQTLSATAEVDDHSGVELLMGKLNTKSRATVTVSGRVSVAFLDAEPVLLLSCTCSGLSQEKVSMKYLSNVGSALLMEKLKTTHNQERSIEMDIVRNHSWHALQMRAFHSWQEINIFFLSRQIDQKKLPCLLCIHEPKAIPLFECDAAHVVEALEDIFSSISTPSEGDRIVVQFTEMNLKYGCTVLCVRITIPDGAILPPQDRINKMVSVAGYVYAYGEDKNSLECVFPISHQIRNGHKIAEATPSQSLRATPEPELNDILFSFIVYEKDLHYSFLVNTFTSDRHRFVRVQSLHELQVELENNADKVSAVLISESLSNFKEMVETVKRRYSDIYIALTRDAVDGLDFLTEPHCLPTHVDYSLSLPIDEERWKNFLHNVSLCQKERGNINPFNNVETIEVLAHGKNTEVALVRDLQTGGTLVQKKILVGATEQSVKEIRIMKLIGSHPYILTYITSKRLSPTCFCIYYPYCRGGTFESRIKERHFTIDELVPFAYQLLSAVSHLHSKGVAHMDIKPSNILLDDKGKLQLADFGSATDEPPKDALHGTTPVYSAPERLLEMPDGWNKATVRPMDALFSENIWSVGLTLLELIGALPELLVNRNLDGILEVYKNLYQESQIMPFDIPLDGSSVSNTIVAIARDFFSRMLQIKPSKRDTAEQLLHHPFIAEMKLRKR